MRHHEDNFKRIVELILVSLMKHEICETLANLNCEAHLFKRYNILSVPREELTFYYFIFIVYALFIRVLTWVDIEIERLIHKYDALAARDCRCVALH